MKIIKGGNIKDVLNNKGWIDEPKIKWVSDVKRDISIELSGTYDCSQPEKDKWRECKIQIRGTADDVLKFIMLNIPFINFEVHLKK